jgi:hypothetical protein
MNADSAGTRHPHLDLGDLIAGVAGRPADARTREHLAGCEACRREASRWDLVAAGVRSLAAAAPEVPGTARRKRTRQRASGRWRRPALMAGSAAAALVLLAGIGEIAGVVHVRFGNGGAETVLTSVTGCPRLQQAEGALVRAEGSSLVVRTASGQPVTVTTTASTPVSISGASRSDITDGASVLVRGFSFHGAIRAAIVTVGLPFNAVRPSGFVTTRGTVSGASAAGFTLVTSGGTRIPVTTSGDTLVVIPHASLDQLRAGAAIFALGHAGRGGTLSARAVAAIYQLPSGKHISVSVKDCSPRSVDEEIEAISGAPDRAG